jgi:hypothetical protein
MPRADALHIDRMLSALAAIEAVAAALVATAPNAVAAMGGIEALMARAEMRPIGPLPRLSIEEWSTMAEERAGADLLRSRVRTEGCYLK